MKTIRTVDDLAINGAPPAFSEALHVGRPNIGDKAQFLDYVSGIFDRAWVTNNGPLVQELEAKIAEKHRVRHCVAMCNGTVALEIAIRALGLEGEVIIPSFTFIATAHALSWQAITPVFADIDPATHHLDPNAVRRMITPKTSGIIGVHLWGKGAPARALQAIADEYGLKLIFDAAHAFGCSLDGNMIGNFGECEILSFHATKAFNSFEGGAVLTNNDSLAAAMRLMRNFGFSGMDNVIYQGTNGKMNEIAAAMGLVNFRSFDKVLERNRYNYHCYQQALETMPGVSMIEYDEGEANNFQYIVLVLDEQSGVNRDELIAVLHAENVRARRYFWPGCHRMKPYLDRYPHSGSMLPVTESISSRVIILPTGLSIDETAITTIMHVVRVFCEGVVN